MKKYTGFTLAEVLITLIVIGVLAMITVPSLLKEYHHRQWKAGLWKAYKISADALEMMRAEDGDHIWERYADYVKLGNKYGDFATPFLSYFNAPLSTKKLYTYYPSYKIYTYTGDMSGSTNWAAAGLTKRLKDGMLIGASINSSAIIITIDINGADKKPNTYGKDCFTFKVDKKIDKLVPMGGEVQGGYEYCSKNYPEKNSNGLGCTYWALKDICPDDPNKGYWECLPN
ncbi:MAG: type II secretion system protein [Candidatus Gastranaerophilales bacterium]|nr:type II secretion system protein [Candidatus Gastranaerophilales bacterium]